MFKARNNIRTSIMDSSLSLNQRSIYTDNDRRYISFKNFPNNSPIYPTRLANAGFEYTGYGDEVVCSICLLRHRNWKKGVNPFSIHANRSPQCKFVKNLKLMICFTKNYVQDCFEECTISSLLSFTRGPFLKQNVVQLVWEHPNIKRIMEMGYSKEVIQTAAEYIKKENGGNFTPEPIDLLEYVWRIEEEENLMLAGVQNEISTDITQIQLRSLGHQQNELTVLQDDVRDEHLIDEFTQTKVDSGISQNQAEAGIANPSLQDPNDITIPETYDIKQPTIDSTDASTSSTSSLQNQKRAEISPLFALPNTMVETETYGSICPWSSVDTTKYHSGFHIPARDTNGRETCRFKLRLTLKMASPTQERNATNSPC